MKRDPHLKQNARKLRTNQTPSEVRVWRALRSHRLQGFRFRRQEPLGRYIVDFYCVVAKLVIELDGESHLGRRAEDAERDAWFRSEGYEVVRCWNHEVYENLDGLLQRVLDLCRRRTPAELLPKRLRSAKTTDRPSPPSPLPDGERGE